VGPQVNKSLENVSTIKDAIGEKATTTESSLMKKMSF
jgi:hypothetical protein